ncbi:hypothetical protein B0A49_04457 [Cryomyces minteri]|uniref:Vacuolar protein 14 C-terminal Fig4-binding domain-containing protein n=1 Tax=Cryomyces minteri TaxID=331657 RepID=A0A4U0XGA1_9PEZI|nr:hypothetical protein B0A49_04457 [Cryomyces minteri]
MDNDVHTSTQTALERFLTEIKKIARIKRGIAESRKSQGEDGPKPSSSSTKSEKSARNEGGGKNASPSAQVTQDGVEEFHEIDSTSTGSDTANDDKSDSLEGDWVPGQDVQVDHLQILDILVTFLHESTEEEVQLTTLRWIDSFFEICPEDILPFVPRLLSQVLPAMSSDVEQVRQAANRVNTSLTEYIMSLSEEPSRAEPVSSGQALLHPPAASVNKDNSAAAERRDSNSAATKLRKTGSLDISADVTTRAHVRTPTPVEASAPSPQPTMDLDYEAAVGTLTLHFLNEHEATRVAALQWLAMLHRKAPRKILAMNDGVSPALLKTLSDPAESVVTRDLLLLSQISKNSDDSYFAAFMVDLLKLFCTDRRLLETRGNLIIRQLCVTLSAERIYRTLADCLEKDDDVEFASIMVQNLNNNLITAPELADLRKRLRNLETKDGQTFFVALFRSWCHNAVATFSLCLLAQVYEQAYNLLQIFAELEMTVNMLIQIDKLVQLLESPVFTCSYPVHLPKIKNYSDSMCSDLRLQLLEPEKFPHLYKCLYGVLMLLPQSSAFAALKNRLNSVSAIGYLHIAPRAYVPQPSTTSSSSTSSMSLYHARHKSSDTPPSSNPSTPGVSSFERGPNRLKARDEGGIKWNELLEKFKTTQERARRAQRAPVFGDDLQPTQEKEKKPAAEQLASKEIQSKLQRPGSAGSATRAPPAAVQPGHAKAKSSLSNLGRFTGGVGARKAKR